MSRYHNKPFAAVVMIFGLVSAGEAADAPSRKPGLWEVKTSIEGQGRAVTVQQCIDAVTDERLQMSYGPFLATACPVRDVKKSDNGMTIDSRCTVVGKPASVHAVITGSLEDAYTMTVTSEGGNMPAMKVTMEGKWLGACTAGQEPGDVVMANGVKVNVPALEKRALAPDTATQFGK